MPVTAVRWSDLVATPWRNGGGITREVAVSPAGDVPFDWRVSIADIEADGTFSAFPGVRRTITCLTGTGMTLELDGVTETVRRSEPFTFAGDTATECRLVHGPTRNLNVMTRPGRADATVVTTDGGEISIGDRETIVVVATETLTVTEPAITLRHLDSLILTAPATVAVTGAATIVRIRDDQPRSPLAPTIRGRRPVTRR